MKKRLITLITVLSLIAGAVGCGTGGVDNDTNKNETGTDNTVRASTTNEKHEPKIVVSDEELEAVKNDYPFLENYLVEAIAEMRRNGQLKSTPYLNALERGDADPFAPRLTYNDVVEIIEKCGAPSWPGGGMIYEDYVSSGQQELDKTACLNAVAEINKIQKYPDLLYDALSDEGTSPVEGSLKYYLTDDDDHIVIVWGGSISVLSFKKPYQKALAFYLSTDPAKAHGASSNVDITMFYPYTGIEYRILRQKTEQALRERGVQVVSGIKSYASANTDEEALKNANPTLSDEMTVVLADMRRNSEDLRTPYIDAVKAGESPERLTYAEIKEIVKNSGYDEDFEPYAIPRTDEEKKDYEARLADNTAACKRIVEEISKKQKYPDVIIDCEQITPFRGGHTVLHPVLVYLTDDPDRIVFVCGNMIQERRTGEIKLSSVAITKVGGRNDGCYSRFVAWTYTELYDSLRAEINT